MGMLTRRGPVVRSRRAGSLPRPSERRQITRLATKTGRPKTLAGCESLPRTHALPTFGGLPVNRIRVSDIKVWLTHPVRSLTSRGVQ